MRSRSAIFALWTLAGCPSEQSVSELVPAIAVAPDAVDFGRVGVLSDSTVTIYVTNGGRAPLDLELSFAEGVADVFSVAETRAEVPVDGAWPIELRFAPETYLTYAATLRLSSNDPERPVVEVPIVGEGVHAPTADIEVDPLALDFGTVAAGGTGTMWLTVNNVGDAPLTLGSTMQTGSGAFVVQTDPSGQVIEGGGSLPVIVQYAPVGDAGDSGRLQLPSDDPDEPMVEIVLLGNGGGEGAYPEAVVDCPDEIGPPTWATVDGSASSDPSGLEPLTWDWRLAQRPAGSQAELSTDDESTTTFFADVAGDYDVELKVTNTAGVSSAPARCTIPAIPADELHVELTWDGSKSDLDLHLRKSGAALFDEPDDCTWCNKNPSWGVSGAADDPRLDLDDRSGLGPENINVEAPADGDYTIAVHYFESNGDGEVTATVRVYAYGVLVEELSRDLARNEVWDVGQVNWPDGTVGLLDTVATAATRDCY